MYSATISREIELAGPGLFSAAPCRVLLRPAAPGEGLSLLLGRQSVPLTIDSVIEHPNCTMVAVGDQRLAVVEHMLAALWAAGVDTLIVQAEGPELPNFDGSPLLFFERIVEAGIVPLGSRPMLALESPIRLEENGAFIEVEPASRLSVEYHFSHPELGEMSYSAELSRETAVHELLPARSFITEREALAAMEAGLLANDDPGSALVLKPGEGGAMEPQSPLRFPDEFARHKVVDLVGDLYLAPVEWTGRITAHRSGHRLNRMLARELMRLTAGASEISPRRD